jgi:ATP-dependent Lon protease
MAKKSEIIIMPMVALRGTVIFPDNMTTIDVGRDMSLNAVNAASQKDMTLFVSAQKDLSKDDVKAEDIYKIGTVVKIRQVVKMPGNNTKLNIQALYRAKIVEFISERGFFEVSIKKLNIKNEDVALEEAYFRIAKQTVKDMAVIDSRIPKDSQLKLNTIEKSNEFINFSTSLFHFKLNDKQKLLEITNTIERLKLFEKLAQEEMEIIKLERKIGGMVRQSIDKSQKEYFLREQIRAIHTELGDDEQEKEMLLKKIKEKKMPSEIEEKAIKEIGRMDKMNPSSPEYTVIRNYLDWLLDLPWTEKTEDTENLTEAKKILDEDHYGLEKVKKRITEYLAVLQLTKSLKAPILCFVGPPGVGKTSVAKSVARALNRVFVRMSLGGVKDEAEIRGHRRTYIGAMPGRIIYAIKNAGKINPVFLLDEIDKLSSDMRGDPSSALLEVLDPEQNNTFRDRFLEVPYDLSKVLFIATSNTLETIPSPLLDRMEVIEINGYTLDEKKEIAKRYLLPKKLGEHGLNSDILNITDEGIVSIIENYTMEAGVRNLEREIAGVCRKVACDYAEHKFTNKVIVTEKNISEFLGVKKFLKEGRNEEDQIGAATGLAWTSVGGTTLTIEVGLMKGKGDIMLTGKLGDVMKESARAAISYIRSNAEVYGIAADAFENTDIHIHIPEGATPKDGPSAGITMATAILSAFIKKPVKNDVAMTGEITLRGRVLPIGGLKEKTLAAHRAGIKNIIIPSDNEKDMEEIPKNIRDSLNFILAKNVDTVFKSSIKSL